MWGTKMAGLRDLWCNPITGGLSHSKLWANIASGVATYKFIMLPEPSYEIWLAYLGIVGGYAVARRFIAAKQQVAEDKNNEN